MPMCYATPTTNRICPFYSCNHFHLQSIIIFVRRILRTPLNQFSFSFIFPFVSFRYSFLFFLCFVFRFSSVLLLPSSSSSLFVFLCAPRIVTFHFVVWFFTFLISFRHSFTLPLCIFAHTHHAPPTVFQSCACIHTIYYGFASHYFNRMSYFATFPDLIL